MYQFDKHKTFKIQKGWVNKVYQAKKKYSTMFIERKNKLTDRRSRR